MIDVHTFRKFYMFLLTLFEIHRLAPEKFSPQYLPKKVKFVMIQIPITVSENPKSKNKNCRGLNYGFLTLY